MTSAKATEFLTKQLSIEKETVTFRWLSRKLSVHVNVAKNELASFYASYRSTDVPIHATYLLTGDVHPLKAAGSYRNDDDDVDVDEDTQESVTTSKIVLVGEGDLEAAKAQFTRTPSVHIYSLSPSVIRDAALLAPMADRVRPDDVSKGKAYNQAVGIVVSSDVKIGQTGKEPKPHPSVSSSKLKPPVVEKKPAEKPRSSEKSKVPEKAKPDEKKRGTLDWSKAKPKGENKTTIPKTTKEVMKKDSKSGVKEDHAKLEVTKDEDPAKPNLTEVEVDADKKAESDKPKRGIKRPSAVMSLSDSEDENPSPKTKARTSASPAPRTASRVHGVKVKKGVLLSDDGEESAQEVTLKAAKRKNKGRVSFAEEEEEEEEDPSVRVMMDLDDAEVVHHNTQVTTTGHQSEEDIEMLSDDEPIPARPKAKRKPKKVIPVGQNGLPKRRVVKSRKSKNAKGYTVTEDYSSYESVSESEQPQGVPETAKKTKKGRQKAVKGEDTNSSSASKPKGSANSKDPADDQSTKTEGSPKIEGKLESKKPGSGSGANGSSTKSGGKASGGGKSNLMSYFGKK